MAYKGHAEYLNESFMRSMADSSIKLYNTIFVLKLFLI